MLDRGPLGPSRFDEFRSENSGPKCGLQCGPARGRRPPDGVDKIVIFSLTIRRAALAAFAASALTFTLTGPGAALAQTPAAGPRVSASGSFLAAQHASRERDPAAA